jgi:hypothetical protein
MIAKAWTFALLLVASLLCCSCFAPITSTSIGLSSSRAATRAKLFTNAPALRLAKKDEGDSDYEVRLRVALTDFPTRNRKWHPVYSDDNKLTSIPVIQFSDELKLQLRISSFASVKKLEIRRVSALLHECICSFADVLQTYRRLWTGTLSSKSLTARR